MNHLLAFDCSGKSLSLAIFQGDTLLLEKNLDNNQQHSVNLLPQLTSLLEATSVRLDDLSALAVTVGPGSFTGIRIGIATANTLAFSLDLPVIGISSLAALAEPYQKDDSLLLPSFDARGGRVFAALFAEGEYLISDRQFVDGQLAELMREKAPLEREIRLVGDGRAMVRKLLTEQGFTHLREVSEHEQANRIQASAVGNIALRLLREAELKKYQGPALPNYCALSQAERNFKEYIV